MLTRFFRQDRLTALLPLPLLVLLLWPGASTGGGSPYATGTGLLGHMVTGMPLYLPISHLMELAPWVASVVSMLVLSGVAMGLVRMANDTELYERRNFLPSLLVVVLLALLPFGLLPDPAMLGMWAVLWALGRTWRAVGRPNVRTALFDAGLLLGLASLFYLPYAFLTVVMWSTLAVTRPLSLREYLLPPLGLATMLFLGWGTAHFFGPDRWDPVGSMHFRPLAPLPGMHWMHRLLLLSVLAVLAISVIVSVTGIYARSVMREKNIRASLLAFSFAMALLALFAWWLDGRIPPVLLAVPGALLLAYPLLQTRKPAWADAALWSLLLLACWARWAG
ncbi:MAG: hypothetical protein KBH07_05880 [Flavobacteriales bacterium]|nr:hypothetical protein [Flavobacteriales bacterium]MBP9080173.1 hypothetical protein [Flavobacteriales bacterium]